MKRVLFIMFFVINQTFGLFANDCSIDSLLRELDKVLIDANLYMEQKEHRIDRLKIQLNRDLTPEKQYELCSRIIDEYKSYMSDSALVYIGQNINLAKEYDRSAWLIQTKLQYSFVLSSSGLFVESEIVMRSIQREGLTNVLLIEYYKCLELLYLNINIYRDGKQPFSDYQDKVRSYRDSILSCLPQNNPERLYYKYLIADSDNKMDNALVYLESYLKTLYPGTHEHAKKSYNLYLLYQRLGNTDQQMKNLILAVISDVKDAVKENRALLDLSVCLYDNNDIDRAFSCIQYALNDANFYNARFRYFEISKALPIITSAYQQKSTKQHNRLIFMFLVISILFISLLVMTLYLYKQKRMISNARKRLKEVNGDLEEVNQRLISLNQELHESNLVKEEYVGYFLDLCSDYVSKLDEYRKMVSNKIAAKRFDELLRTTSSSSEKTREVKELYANFDKAFLNIYPGFVSAFNRLLKEEERFDIKKGELNTELRIFALIRLGIADSAKIATFLRCSVQTVYNYRSKIKRNCIIEGEDVEARIKRIGID